MEANDLRQENAQLREKLDYATREIEMKRDEIKTLNEEVTILWKHRNEMLREMTAERQSRCDDCEAHADLRKEEWRIIRRDLNMERTCANDLHQENAQLQEMAHKYEEQMELEAAILSKSAFNLLRIIQRKGS